MIGIHVRAVSQTLRLIPGHMQSPICNQLSIAFHIIMTPALTGLCVLVSKDLNINRIVIKHKGTYPEKSEEDIPVVMEYHPTLSAVGAIKNIFVVF